jgi:hypothetical protein
LIDDMSGSNISLAPPSCGSSGSWTVFSAALAGTRPGAFTLPAGEPSVLSNCGSLCQSLYSQLPPGLPGPAATVDGGAAGTQALCVAGETGAQPYSSNGITLTFAHAGTAASGAGPAMVSSRTGFTSDPPPALIDASQYTGIELWLWASPETVAEISSGFIVQLIDRNQLPGGGVCFPSFSTGPRSCWSAGAGIPFDTAKGPTRFGPLFGTDGIALTSLTAGWQLVRIPWSSFLTRPDFGGGNEDSVDPTTLAFARFAVAQNSATGSGLPFDFCVYGLRFYK